MGDKSEQTKALPIISTEQTTNETPSLLPSSPESRASCASPISECGSPLTRSMDFFQVSSPRSDSSNYGNNNNIRNGLHFNDSNFTSASPPFSTSDSNLYLSSKYSNNNIHSHHTFNSKNLNQNLTPNPNSNQNQNPNSNSNQNQNQNSISSLSNHHTPTASFFQQHFSTNTGAHVQLASPSISKNMKIIKLNIGGVVYQTTKSTLLKYPDTYFSILLDGPLNTTVDDGAFFIDRDGQFFAPILTWLRTNEISLPIGVAPEDVIREAKFYGFANLIEILEQGLTEQQQMAAPAPEPFTTSKEVVDYVRNYWARQHKQIHDLLFQLHIDGYTTATLVILPAHRQDFERPPQLVSENTIGLHMNFTGLKLIKCARVQCLLAECLREKGYRGWFRSGERIEVCWWSAEKASMRQDGPVVYF